MATGVPRTCWAPNNSEVNVSDSVICEDPESLNEYTLRVWGFGFRVWGLGFRVF